MKKDVDKYSILLFFKYKILIDIGDLGNIYSDGINDAKLELTDKLITLSGPYSIIGRACVVHAD